MSAMKPRVGLLGVIGIAAIVFLIAVILKTPPITISRPTSVDTIAPAIAPPPPLSPARLNYQPPGPPVLEDLPAELSGMTAAAAAAYLHVDRNLFTRFTRADSNYIPCDEGMPGELLFVADARVLGQSGNADDTHVPIEVVTVGEAEAEWDGCDFVSAKVDERVKVDTVNISVQRSELRWTERCCWRPLVGPLWQVRGVNWDALRARADSVRTSRGKLPARPRKERPTFGYKDTAVPKFRDYPRDRSCGPQVRAQGGDNRGEIEYSMHFQSNVRESTGKWWVISELGGGANREMCISPIEITVQSMRRELCGLTDTRIAAYQLTSTTPEPKPWLLVRNLAGLRTGAQPVLSIIRVPGWNQGESVYSDSGEVLRVVESSARGDSLSLSVLFEGVRQPLVSVQRDSTTDWSVFWAGFLNGDTAPDLILLISRLTPDRADHRLQLVLSEPRAGGRIAWMAGDEADMRMCLNGVSY